MYLALNWSETCVITSMEKRILVAGQPNRGDSPESAAFKKRHKIVCSSSYFISCENDNKLLEQLKTGFKGTIRSQFKLTDRSNIF